MNPVIPFGFYNPKCILKKRHYGFYNPKGTFRLKIPFRFDRLTWFKYVSNFILYFGFY